MVEKQKRAQDNEKNRSDVEVFDNGFDEYRERSHQTLEQAEKQHKSDRLEREAAAKAAELAEEADNAKEDENRKHNKAIERHRGAPSKKQLEETFDSEMKSVRAEMSLSGRLISYFIHSLPIEKSGEFIGSTLARPNAMLSGSIAAFICITLVYFVARHYGYQLSGFETIGAFVVGWIVGIVYDYIVGIVRRR